MTPTKNFQVTTLENARRLLKDSKHLTDDGRNESAIVLAVLAIEELGKHLIERWGVKNEGSTRKHPTHIEKQSATFVLLHAREVITASPKKQRKLMQADQPIRLWGPYSEQLQWSKAGFYDQLRLAATYADKQPEWPQEILDTLGDFKVAELHTTFQKALIASRDKKFMELAAVVYKNGLGDL